MKYNDNYFILFTILTLGLAYTATDIYLPALPDIQQYFDITINQAQYTLSAYLFGLAFAQLIAGPIIDSLGYRRILLPLLFAFIVVTLVCAFSPNIFFLIVLRCLQALAAGMISVLARASFIKRFEPARAAYLLATFGPFLVLSGVFAPVIGGFIAHYMRWQGVFIVLALYSTFILFAILRYFYVNETNLTLSYLKPKHIFTTYFTILKHKGFLQCIFVNCIALGTLFTYVAEAPFIYHQVGYTDKEIGLSFIPLSFSFLLASQLNRLWYHKLKMDTILIVAIAFIIVGLAVMSIPALLQGHYLIAIFGIAITAFGLGLATPIAFGKATTLFPKQAGYAAGILTAIPFIFSVSLTLSVHPICGNNIAILSIFLATITFFCMLAYYLLREKTKIS